MWPKSGFSNPSYQKIDEDEKKKMDVQPHNFNYRKMRGKRPEAKAEDHLEHENQKMRSHSTSSQPPAYSSQQTYLVPPIFPVVPQRFTFLG